MPAYNDTPKPTDRISATQDLIRTNYLSLSTTVDVNHESITTATDFGKHAKIDLTNITAEPTAAATQLVAYNFLNTDTTKQELYIRRNGEDGVPWATCKVW
jgi:hypothetical protein